MKYYNSTLFKKIAFIVLFAFVSILSTAQLSTVSPYSSFGIGELRSSTSINRVGVGSMTAAWKDYFSINSANPATYTQLARTTFQVEGYANNTTFTDASSQQEIGISGLDNINFVFKKSGGLNAFALGLRKMTSTGYNISDVLDLEEFGDGTFHYEGEGGINVFNVGYAREIRIKRFTGLLESDAALDSLDKEKLRIVRYRFALGANSDWSFGVTDKVARTEFEDVSFVNSKISSRTQVKDVNFTIGVHGNINLYHKNLLEKTQNKRLDFLFGVAYTLGNDMQATFSNLNESYVVNTNGTHSHIDTISFLDPSQGHMVVPHKLDIGIGLLKDNNNGGLLQWGLNYTSQDWSDFETVIDGQTITSNLDKATTIATGLEYTPKRPGSNNSQYIKLLTYRVGARLSDTYLTLEGQSIDEKVVSAGISLPFLRSGSLSKLNLGMEFGTRGTTDNGLLQEDFTNLYVGFTFTPHKDNRWFLIRKNE